tara:strand:- start:791 stop:1042 length:252 start_codon:yes stop_codon:yes gene_type:complete
MTSPAELKALAENGSLTWELEDGMGGDWLRHDLGNGIDAILHDNEDETSLHITISRYETGEILLGEDTKTIAEAEATIARFSN